MATGTEKKGATRKEESDSRWSRVGEGKGLVNTHAIGSNSGPSNRGCRGAWSLTTRNTSTTKSRPSICSYASTPSRTRWTLDQYSGSEAGFGLLKIGIDPVLIVKGCAHTALQAFERSWVVTPAISMKASTMRVRAHHRRMQPFCKRQGRYQVIHRGCPASIRG